MDTFFRLISAIPGTVWAALAGSFLTLIGVVLSNNESRKRYLTQLKHDSDQRDRERYMSRRWDVYLEAAESISRGLSLIGRLVDLDTSDQEISTAYQSDLARIAKIQVVATDKTVQTIGAFSSEFTSIYLQLTLDRIPLNVRKSHIGVLETHREKASREVDRYLELMRQLSLEGKSDPRLWKVINENLAFQRKQQEDYSQQRQALAIQQAKQHMALVKSCVDQSLRLSTLLPPAIFAVRDELELPVNREEYMKSFNDGLERNMAALASFLEKVQRLIDAAQPDATRLAPGA